MSHRVKRTPAWYWAVGAVLSGFGFLTGLSIGLPFLLVGLALLLLQPFLNKPRTFWPGLLGVLAFIGGYILVTPLGCTTEAVSAGSGQVGHTSCSNLLGIDYSGTGVYNPSLWPAALAGLGTGLLIGSVARRIISWRSRPTTVGRAS